MNYAFKIHSKDVKDDEDESNGEDRPTQRDLRVEFIRDLVGLHRMDYITGRFAVTLIHLRVPSLLIGRWSGLMHCWNDED